MANSRWSREDIRGAREDIRGNDREARRSMLNNTLQQHPQNSFSNGHFPNPHYDDFRQYSDIQFTNEPFDGNLDSNMVVHNRHFLNGRHSQNSNRNERHGPFPFNPSPGTNYSRNQRYDFDTRDREIQPSKSHGKPPTSNHDSSCHVPNLGHNPNNFSNQSRENSARGKQSKRNGLKAEPLLKGDVGLDNTRVRQCTERNTHVSAGGLLVDNPQVKDASSAKSKSRSYQPEVGGKNLDNQDGHVTSYSKRKPEGASNRQQVNNRAINERNNTPVSSSNSKLNKIASSADDNEDKKTVRTKAGLTISKQFTGPKNVMETMNQCKPQMNNVNLTFIEDSITCGGNKSYCVVVLLSESKQAAEEWIQNLCQNLKKSLKTEVTCDISSTEDIEKGQQQRVPSHENTRVKGLINRFEKTSKDRNNLSPRCDDKRVSSQVHIQERKGKISKPDSKPLPTKILITIGKEFPDKDTVQDFLKGF